MSESPSSDALSRTPSSLSTNDALASPSAIQSLLLPQNNWEFYWILLNFFIFFLKSESYGEKSEQSLGHQARQCSGKIPFGLNDQIRTTFKLKLN